MSIDSVLVVCTANICRSPLAEVVLREALPKVAVESAGVAALVDESADPNARAVALEHGLDVSSHIARQIDAQLILQNELVLAMDAQQINWIVQQFPHARGRVFLLGHWSNESEVPDPYRLPIETYRDVFSLIEEYAAQWRARVG